VTSSKAPMDNTCGKYEVAFAENELRHARNFRTTISDLPSEKFERHSVGWEYLTHCLPALFKCSDVKTGACT
jgi:hypothetical protein